MLLTPASQALLWRKLDQPGYDLCQFVPLPDGFCICGAAMFMDSGTTCQLDYEVMLDSRFHTTRASVVGLVGARRIHLQLRSAGPARWEVNGRRLAAADGCLDVDLGFTPATNMLPIRRLSLKVGQQAQAPAVYLGVPQMTFSVLAQTYRRIAHRQYVYEAPAFRYKNTLTVSGQGWVVMYPGLFELVDA